MATRYQFEIEQMEGSWAPRGLPQLTMTEAAIIEAAYFNPGKNGRTRIVPARRPLNDHSQAIAVPKDNYDQQ